MIILDILDDLDFVIDDMDSEGGDCEEYVKRLREISLEILEFYKDNQHLFMSKAIRYDA